MVCYGYGLSGPIFIVMGRSMKSLCEHTRRIFNMRILAKIFEGSQSVVLPFYILKRVCADCASSDYVFKEARRFRLGGNALVVFRA